MIDLLERYGVEIKYLGLTLLTLLGLGAFAATGVLDSFEADLSAFMHELTRWGWIGMFLIAYISNLTLVMPLPYGLPLFTLVLYAVSPLDALRLGLGAGIGAGLGAASSYVVAHSVLAQVEDPGKSWLFRVIATCTRRWPRSVLALVWLLSATPAPEGMVTTSLAMVRYPWRVIALVVFTGKVIGNLVMSQLYYFAADLFAGYVSRDMHITATIVLIALFVIVIAYQIEKALLLRSAEPQRDHPEIVSGS